MAADLTRLTEPHGPSTRPGFPVPSPTRSPPLPLGSVPAGARRSTISSLHRPPPGCPRLLRSPSYLLSVRDGHRGHRWCTSRLSVRRTWPKREWPAGHVATVPHLENAAGLGGLRGATHQSGGPPTGPGSRTSLRAARCPRRPARSGTALQGRRQRENRPDFPCEEDRPPPGPLELSPKPGRRTPI